MAKKKSIKKRIVYLDVIVGRVENFEITCKNSGESLALKKVYWKLLTTTQEIDSPCIESSNPVWDADATFILRNNDELMLELYSKKKKKAKFIGQVVISTKEFVLDKLIEISREIQPPPSCENHKYLVSGKIQMKLFKSHNSRKMLLSHYGTPTRDLPLRLDIGDIILCSTQNILTTTVHISTRSQWDHVAMIVKKRDQKKFYLFEATIDGVETYLLNTALKYYREHSKVAIRRALVKKDEVFRNELYSFIEEVLGRPYKQDWMQLIRAAYNANEEDDLTSLFCSQLIAAAYQRLGIISKDVPSNNFVPSDFALDQSEKLKGGLVGDVRKIPPISKKSAITLSSKAEQNTPSNILFDQKHIDVITCVKITETATKKDSKLQIHTVYIMNVLTSNGTKWILFKRFNEFIDIDKELKKYFTGIPKLKKKITVNKQDSLVQKRRAILQKYIKSLVNSPIIRCSLLIDFLTLGRKGVQNPDIVDKNDLSLSLNLKSDSKSDLSLQINLSQQSTCDSPRTRKKKKGMRIKSPISDSDDSQSDSQSPPEKRRRKKTSRSHTNAPLSPRSSWTKISPQTSSTGDLKLVATHHRLSFSPLKDNFSSPSLSSGFLKNNSSQVNTNNNNNSVNVDEKKILFGSQRGQTSGEDNTSTKSKPIMIGMNKNNSQHHSFATLSSFKSTRVSTPNLTHSFSSTAKLPLESSNEPSLPPSSNIKPSRVQSVSPSKSLITNRDHDKRKSVLFYAAKFGVGNKSEGLSFDDEDEEEEDEEDEEEEEEEEEEEDKNFLKMQKKKEEVITRMKRAVSDIILRKVYSEKKLFGENDTFSDGDIWPKRRARTVVA